MSHNLTLALARAQVAAARLLDNQRDADCLDACRDHLMEALAELDTLEALKTHRVELRYLSPCPTGYDTILGYLAKHNPGVLELLDKEPDATRVDGVKLRDVAKRRNLKWVKVEASPWLKGFGIETVTAYPIRLLADYFGV